MFNSPQIISICNDQNFFIDVASIEHIKVTSKITPQLISKLIKNLKPNYIVLSGKYLKVKEWIKYFSQLNINISLELENDDLLNHLKNYNNCIYQIRYPIFLDELIKNKTRYFKNIIKLASMNNEYRVIIIYITNKSFKYLDLLDVFVERLIKLDFMVCIFPLPINFLKEEYRITKNEFWTLANTVNKIADKFAPMVYGDFPVCSHLYPNLEGMCPSIELLINISQDGTLTPCRFTNLNLGNIKYDAINSVWAKWKSIDKGLNNPCNHCSSLSSCRSGCIANWDTSKNIDQYCHFI